MEHRDTSPSSFPVLPAIDLLQSRFNPSSSVRLASGFVATTVTLQVR